ncbi:acetyltransferase [Ectocarpus siliculosus]|uniref:Acetyltransferase n=1 Tax=Ectocarpus siliculosus TaxID=2880 RepID=D7FLJ8_ECTSI|nr:acetyltransferase [Ectocarpus siliculosus]|eukprot:CBJ25814.1 acetyltransferase [Ectocarpus siliculosus]
MGVSGCSNGAFSVAATAIQAFLVVALGGCEAFTLLSLPGVSSVPPSLVSAPGSASSSSPQLQASTIMGVRKEMPLDHSRTTIVFALRNGDRSRRAKLNKTMFVLKGTRLGANAAAAGGSTEKAGSSKLGKGGQKARVTVRRAREPDYQGVAEIRGVIIPVGMSGATGFLGGKVVIDDPAEAERRLLMAKVADLVSGESVALIALEGQRIVGTVDCIIRSAAATVDTLGQPKQQPEIPKANEVFLKNLFVLPERRRQGIARELVNGAEVFARQEKARTVCLDVARQNDAARELYLSCGFEEAERPGPIEGGMGGALLRSLGMGKKYMVKGV